MRHFFSTFHRAVAALLLVAGVCRRFPASPFAVLAVLAIGSINPIARADILYAFNSSDGGWTKAPGDTVFAWSSNTGIGGQGVWEAYGANFTRGRLISPTMFANGSPITVTIQHRWTMEYRYDGATIAMAKNASPSFNWSDYQAAYFNTVGGYNYSPIPGIDFGSGWTSVNYTDPYYTSSQTFTGFNPGDTLNLALFCGWDSSTVYGPPAWQIASVDVTNVTTNSVPEIDPAGMGSVMALVTGGLGLLERRRLAPKRS